MRDRDPRRLFGCQRRHRIATSQVGRYLEQLEERRVLAAAFLVDTVDDTVDVKPGDGLAEDEFGRTSLRAAIMEANALPGRDTIKLPAGNYQLTIAGPDADAQGDLDLTDAVSIVGEHRDKTTISSSKIVDRIFDIPRKCNGRSIGYDADGRASGQRWSCT